MSTEQFQILISRLDHMDDRINSLERRVLSEIQILKTRLDSHHLDIVNLSEAVNRIGKKVLA